jgi:hypothetical protein
MDRYGSARRYRVVIDVARARIVERALAHGDGADVPVSLT